MSSQSLSSPVSATARIPALAFSWVLTLCAVFAPMLVIVSAFAISPDAIERAQIIVQGLESTALALVAALILNALYVFEIKSESAHRIRALGSASAVVSA